MLACVAAGAHAVHAAEPDVDFRTFALPYPNVDQSAPEGINDLGQIVGSYHDISTGYHGFLFDGRQFISLDAPDPMTHETHAKGNNRRGQVVGYLEVFNPTGGREFHGFILERGVFHRIDVPFAGPGGTLARGINDRGDIVGVYLDDQGEVHGFLLDRGVFHRIDVPFPSASATAPSGINNRGRIVGTYDSPAPDNVQGFEFQRGTYGRLDTPPASITNGTLVSAINDRGQIAGCLDGQAFVLEHGVFHEITVPFEGGCPLGINNRGVMVGNTSGPQGFIGLLRR